jgi:hypothetical protein
VSAQGQPACGPNGDDQYCPRYWELSAERDALAEENTRLRMLIGELLDSTGLDDAERAEWLDRNRLSESAVYPDGDEGEDDGRHPGECPCQFCEEDRREAMAQDDADDGDDDEVAENGGVWGFTEADL